MVLFCAQLLITAVVVLLLLKWVAGLPVRAAKPAHADAQAELAFYRSRMAELAGAQDQGLLDRAGAEEARLELARQVLDGQGRKPPRRPVFFGRFFRLFLLLAVLSVPLFTWAVYSLLGNPNVPARPFSAFLARDPATLDAAEQLVLAEVRAYRAPQDGALAEKLGDTYLAAGRFQDAANSYSRAMMLNGENARLLLRYAIALTGFNDGVVSEEAEQVLRQAIKLEPDNAYAYIGLATGLVQNGKPQEAVALLEHFLQTTSADTPQRDRIAAHIAALKQTGAMAVPEQPAATDADMREKQRYVAENIGRLAAHVEANPHDTLGWKMLIEAWLVLEKPQEARAALQKALKLLPAADAEALAAYAHQRGVAPVDSAKENVVE